MLLLFPLPILPDYTGVSHGLVVRVIGRVLDTYKVNQLVHEGVLPTAPSDPLDSPNNIYIKHVPVYKI